MGGYFEELSVGDSCLVTGLPLITFHYCGGLLWEALRRGQLLSNRVTFDDFSSLQRGTCVLWQAFRRGQLLSNRVTFDDFSLLRVASLGSLPLGTEAW